MEISSTLGLELNMLASYLTQQEAEQEKNQKKADEELLKTEQE